MSDPTKAPLHLIPFSVLEEVARAFASGNVDGRKPDDWKGREDLHEFMAAMLRHTGRASDGETRDEKSGRHPLAHAVANGLILLWHHQNQQAASIEELDTLARTAEPVCLVCNDTHQMRDGERLVMCTHCWVPCGKCADEHNAAFCKTTPCPCDCHK